MFQGPSPFYHWWVRPLARTPGIDNEALQSVLELPLFDPSGPTDPNIRQLSYSQGAQLSGPQIQVVAGTQGVINQKSFTLAGLLATFDPNFKAPEGAQ